MQSMPCPLFLLHFCWEREGGGGDPFALFSPQTSNLLLCSLLIIVAFGSKILEPTLEPTFRMKEGKRTEIEKEKGGGEKQQEEEAEVQHQIGRAHV